MSCDTKFELVHKPCGKIIKYAQSLHYLWVALEHVKVIFCHYKWSLHVSLPLWELTLFDILINDYIIVHVVKY